MHVLDTIIMSVYKQLEKLEQYTESFMMHLSTEDQWRLTTTVSHSVSLVSLGGAQRHMAAAP